MKKFVLIAAVALFALPASAALAVPRCDGPDFDKVDSQGHRLYDEQAEAERAEMMLHSYGIDAHLTRFWQGCIQTFVKEGGKDRMKFYDPDTYREIPVN
jgi:hypothetical protein